MSKTCKILLRMLKDRIALDLPFYEGLLAGYYRKSPGYSSKRTEGTDDWLLIATLSGEGRIGTQNGDIPMTVGTLTLIAPGTPHDYGIAKGSDLWELLWVHFQAKSDWLGMLNWKNSSKGIAVAETNKSAWAGIVEAFWEVHRLSFAPHRNRLKFAVNALERLLLLCEDEASDVGTSLDPRIQRVVEYLQGDLATQISIESLSSMVFLSPSRFSHLFRDQMGMAPLQYVSLQRIRRSSILLERTTLSIAEIATQVGMDPFQFSSKFKMETGMNPRDYRKENRQNSV